MIPPTQSASVLVRANRWGQLGPPMGAPRKRRQYRSPHDDEHPNTMLTPDLGCSRIHKIASAGIRHR